MVLDVIIGKSEPRRGDIFVSGENQFERRSNFRLRMKRSCDIIPPLLPSSATQKACVSAQGESTSCLGRALSVLERVSKSR